MKKTIMIVDDEPGLAKLISILLEEWGYDVLWYEDVKKAIEALNNCVIHLLLTDVNMPEIKGNDLARIAKDMAKTDSILMSSDPSMESLALKEGLGFFNKLLLWEEKGEDILFRKIAEKVKGGERNVQCN